MVNVDPKATVLIDLRRCPFVRPVGLVFIAIAMLSIEPSRQIRLRFTDGSDLAKYADRMGLGAVAQRCGAWTDPFPGVRRHDPRQRFLELTRFDSSGDSVIDDVCNTLRAKSADWQIDGKRLNNMVFELGVNVEHHAGSAGLVAVQHYPTERAVEFAIGDHGIGIRKSLVQAGYDFPTSDAAITAAVETMATRTGDSFRGRGLPDLRQMICGEGLRGSLAIQSGQWRVTYSHGREIPHRIKLSYDQPGTLAFGRFSTG